MNLQEAKSDHRCHHAQTFNTQHAKSSRHPRNTRGKRAHNRMGCSAHLTPNIDPFCHHKRKNKTSSVYP